MSLSNHWQAAEHLRDRGGELSRSVALPPAICGNTLAVTSYEAEGVLKRTS